MDNQLLLNIIDNGIGITISQLNDSRSIGLIGMKERATHVGGTIHVHNRDEGGVKVKLVVPIFI